jgi:glucose dehydrogenase
MDKTTRKVLVVIAALFGLFFLVAGILLLLEGRSAPLAVIYIPLGLLWLVAAVFIYRRVPKL